MPFIGRDWRSPGEAWVKTESLGWQRMKIIESQLYLTCHQNHSSACSWPPRSQYGQHMEANCGGQEAAMGGAQPAAVAESSIRHELSGTSSSSSRSAGSSRAGSGPTSPSSTPEKNNGSRHIHPIAISSPYGRLSAACTHNSHDSASGASSPCKSPPIRVSHCNNCSECRCHNVNHHNDAQAMSRSLSRETINRPLSSSSSSNEPTTPRMRYNNSVSDFRNNRVVANNSCNEFTTTRHDGPSSTSANSDNQARVSESSQPKMVVTSARSEASNQQSEPNVDSFNKSNLQIGDNVDTLAPNNTTEPTSLSPTSPSRSSSPLASISPPVNEAPGGSLMDEDSSQAQACACCCCCSTQSGGVNSHYHLIMEMQPPRTAPHCQISVRTREVAMHNTISEAFYRLDFYNAIHDIRRFNYICKLLHLLITQNLTSLSGCATRVLFTMLEQVAWEVSSNKRNVHIIRNLLAELRNSIKKYYCWGRPIGSSALWQQHFETIERISQIVDGIDLSPPKSDSYKVTFDKLPAEMVREILLRLDDYRDLVSSAQASPVMQTMIDSQSIWQKLCHYHFTEQQLKMALNSGSSSILKKKSILRGVKYARTSSADGRRSYRNPVSHKEQAPTSSFSSVSRAAATCRQLEQTSARRGSRAERRDSSSSSSSSSGGSGNVSPSTSESYVTSAVKLFDDKQKRLQARANCDNHQPSSSGGGNTPGTRRASLRTAGAAAMGRQEPTGDTCGSGGGQSIESQSSNVEIDWERVFHQLRKRFDLKEEYADCLLLCRHCRCLFWKSFGHPCIKGEDMRQQPASASSGRQYGKPAASNRAPATPQPARNNGQDGAQSAAPAPAGPIRQPDQRNPPRDDGSGPSTSSSSSAFARARPSVASLSRSFDRATLSDSSGSSSSGSHPPDENAQPSGPREGAVGANSHNRQYGANGRQGQALPRQPLNNLNAQLRERNSANRQQLPPSGLEHLDSRRGEELVPKHVTVSPQAFLKFFSL